MRSSTPYPCGDPNDTAFRINRSSVPGRISVELDIGASFLNHLGKANILLLSCQGEAVMGIHLRRLACAARGKVNEGDRLLLGALPSGLERKEEGGRTDVYAYRAQVKLWCTSFSAAASLAGRALALAQIGR